MHDFGIWIALGVVVVSLAICMVVVGRQLNRGGSEWERYQRERDDLVRRADQLYGINIALQAQITTLIATNDTLKVQLSEEIESLAKLRASVHDQRNEINVRETLRDVEKVELKVKLEETSRKLDDAVAQIAAFTCKAEDRVEKAEDRADERAEKAEARADERAEKAEDRADERVGNAAGSQPHAPEGR